MQPNDQNPERPVPSAQPTPQQQPHQLPQAQPTSGSSMGRTLRPLSSEDDIRSAAEAVTPEPRTQEEPSATEDVQADSLDTGTFVAEPPRPRPQSSIPNLHTTPLETSLQKGGGKKILAAILSLIVVGGVGFGVYYFFFSGNQLQLLPNPNLVKETSGNTTYMRPKDWTQISLANSTTAYGQESNGKISAFVTIEEAPAPIDASQMDNLTHDKMRELLVASASTPLVQPTFNKAGVNCTSKIDVKAEGDTKKANGINGLMSARGSCTYEDGEFVVKLRSVIGDDRLSRIVTVAARSETWTQDEKMLQSVLDSIGQAETTQ